MKTFKTDEDLFDELKDKYTKLITANRTLFEENVARGKLIDQLESRNVALTISATKLVAQVDARDDIIEKAMRAFDLYLNVPESRELKAQWNKLKAPTSPESSQSP